MTMDQKVAWRLRQPPLWLALWTIVPGALVALPVCYVLLRSWQAGTGGIVHELFRARTADLLVNTLTLVSSVTVLSCAIGLAVGWCIIRSDLPGRRAWQVVVALPLALPAFVTSYAWASLGNAFQGMGGAILILTVSSLPLVALPVMAALRATDPHIEQVTRTMGYGPWETFWFAVLPQLMPALGGGALLVASHMFAEFGALVFLRVETFTTAIFDQYELQFDNAAAALLSGVLLLFCIPMVLVEMRLRAGGRVARVGVGSVGEPITMGLGRLRWPVFGLFVAGALVAFAVPLVTLGSWLLAGRSAGEGLERLGEATMTSLWYASLGAGITTVLALPLVILSSRYAGRLARLADRVPYLIHGLPGIVVALAFVSLAISYAPGIYQSVLLVFLAYAVLFLPVAQSAIRSSLELVPAHWEGVARTLGRGPLAAFASVTLPNILPGIGVALSLVSLQLMRELTATLLLAPSGTVTLATEFWSHTNDRAYAAAAPFAAMLTLVSGVPVYLFTLGSLIGADRRRRPAPEPLREPLIEIVAD
jgi:iron(III) transport system permease protein